MKIVIALHVVSIDQIDRRSILLNRPLIDKDFGLLL